MGQHELSTPVTGTSLPAPSGSSPLRLLFAFGLGLTAPFFFAPIAVEPRWWQPVIVLAILLGAALLSTVRAGGGPYRVPTGWMIVQLIAIVGVIGGLGAAFLALRQQAEAATAAARTATATATESQVAFQWNLLAAALVPVLIGMASALVGQRRPNGIRALGGAELGWLGAFLANILVALFGPILDPAAPNPEGVGVAVVVVAMVSVVGFALVVPGGLLGWGLCKLGAAAGAKRLATT